MWNYTVACEFGLDCTAMVAAIAFTCFLRCDTAFVRAVLHNLATSVLFHAFLRKVRPPAAGLSQSWTMGVILMLQCVGMVNAVHRTLVAAAGLF